MPKHVIRVIVLLRGDMLVARMLLVGLVALTGCSLSERQIYERIRKSEVKITIPDVGSASGFIIEAPSGRRVTVTNYHVCGDASELFVSRLGEFSEIKVSVLKIDPNHDLCLTSEAPGEALDLGGTAGRYEQLYMVGAPYGQDTVPSTGRAIAAEQVMLAMPPKGDAPCLPGFQRISSPFAGILPDLCVKPFDLVTTNIHTFPGNSGSAVVDENARVVGVMNSGHSLTMFGNFVDVSYLKLLLRGL